MLRILLYATALQLQITKKSFCQKQSSLFSFDAMASSGILKDALFHCFITYVDHSKKIYIENF